MVGTDAFTKVRGIEKPTMVLNLKGFHPDLQKSLVIHEFGHVLGLEHEHQRPDFWDVVKKHLDKERMLADPRVSESDWFESKDAGVNMYSDYDPLGIMHFWFDLKDEAFQVYENIDKCSYLDDKEKPCVFGHQLPKLPSVNDIKRLAKGYGHDVMI